jgi:DNA-binding MarR family transcriptional regulator
VQISSLAFAARVPHSTAIRWARIMTAKGLILREKDPRDARRIHVRLSPLAHQMLAEFFGKLWAQGQVPEPVLAKPP